MRRMPEIEVENGKVKSIDGIAIGGNFVIENETPKDDEIENNGNVSGDGISSVTGINYFEGCYFYL